MWTATPRGATASSKCVVPRACALFPARRGPTDVRGVRLQVGLPSRLAAFSSGGGGAAAADPHAVRIDEVRPPARRGWPLLGGGGRRRRRRGGGGGDNDNGDGGDAAPRVGQVAELRNVPVVRTGWLAGTWTTLLAPAWASTCEPPLSTRDVPRCAALRWRLQALACGTWRCRASAAARRRVRRCCATPSA
eukprot:scaffold2272_cov297-Prasinococcus_capsulatus_cf.AAC.5